MNNSMLTDVTGGYGDNTLTFTRLKSDGNTQFTSHHHQRKYLHATREPLKQPAIHYEYASDSIYLNCESSSARRMFEGHWPRQHNRDHTWRDQGYYDRACIATQLSPSSALWSCCHTTRAAKEDIIRQGDPRLSK